MTTMEHMTPSTGEPEVPGDTSIADTVYLPELPSQAVPIEDYDPFDVDPEDVDDK